MPLIVKIPKGDLKLEKGQLVFVSGADHVQNKIAHRLGFFLGEWFLDTRQGLPYYRDVFRKRPDLDVIRSVFRHVIVHTPGVKALRSLSLSYDESARELTVGFEAVTTDDDVIIQEGDRTFIVRV